MQLGEELRELRKLGLAPPRGVPSHLAGVPECLHKYGPLFERRVHEAEAPETSSA
jgi:hypothetical protein